MLQSKLASVADELTRSFDFDITRVSEDWSWIELSEPEPFAVLAGDAAGGVFLAYGDASVEENPVLYASSEGQAGRIAEDLSSLLAMLLSLPFWIDLLHFSGEGNLQEMRNTVAFAGPEYQNECPELLADRHRIQSVLSVPPMKHPILRLHGSVHATDCTLIGEDGCRYESLFGSFVASDNPGWRSVAT